MNSLWNEIKRRKVGRVTVAYVVICWLSAQVAEFATATFGAPPWVLQIFVVFLLLGLPIAVILAWVLDITPQGIRRTPSKEIETNRDEEPQAKQRTLFVAFVLITVSFAAWMQFYGPEPVDLSKRTEKTSAAPASNDGHSSHFDLAFPPDAPLALIGAAELGNGRQAFAISPNGKLVVYAGASGNGYQLYLRDLSEHTTVPLEGTTNAFSPFFAPNNAWIGYFVGSTLHKVHVNGGEPVFVAEAINSVGATWTSSDDIVMVIEEGCNILKVSASGGNVVDLDQEVGCRMRFPSAIRGHDKIISSGYIVDQESLQIDELPVSSPDMRYADGYLFFTSQGSLLAARYNLGTNAIESNPIPVITGLRVEVYGAAQWSLSEDGTLLYMPGGDARANPLYWVNENQSTPLDLPIRFRGSMEISPDGKRFAVSEASGNTKDIWIYELASKRATKLTTDGISKGPLFWSPDSNSVYYQKEIEADIVTYQSYLNSQRPAERVLPAEVIEMTATSISADGRILGLHSRDGIAAYDVASQKMIPVPTASKDDWGSAVAPNGRAMIYTSSAAGAYHTYLQPLPPTGKRYQISREGGAEEPRWSADGSKIYYRSGTRIMMAEVVTEPEIQIREPEVFYSGVFENVGGRSYAIHPDGDRALVIHSEDFSSSIRVVTNWFAKVERLVQESEAESN